MGETCGWPLPSSSVDEVSGGGTLVLGVAGVAVMLATFPINHDCHLEVSEKSTAMKIGKHTGTQPRSPPSSLTA